MASKKTHLKAFVRHLSGDKHQSEGKIQLIV